MWPIGIDSYLVDFCDPCHPVGCRTHVASGELEHHVVVDILRRDVGRRTALEQ